MIARTSAAIVAALALTAQPPNDRATAVGSIFVASRHGVAVLSAGGATTFERRYCGAEPAYERVRIIDVKPATFTVMRRDRAGVQLVRVSPASGAERRVRSLSLPYDNTVFDRYPQLFVVDPVRNRIRIVDAVSGREAAIAAERVRHVAAAAGGFIVVSAGAVTSYAPSRTVRWTRSVTNGVLGALAPDGSVYVVTRASDDGPGPYEVRQMDRAGTIVRVLHPQMRVISMIVDRHGRAFFGEFEDCSSKRSMVELFEPGALRARWSVELGVDVPVAMALSGDGGLLVANTRCTQDSGYVGRHRIDTGEQQMRYVVEWITDVRTMEAIGGRSESR